jgi:hypothetical protein
MAATLTTRPSESVRICSVCKRELSLSEFSRHLGRKDGRASRCRECNAAHGRQWYRRKQEITGGLYSTWVAMRARCHNPKHDSFPSYGGRGVEVCREWRESFESFEAWAQQNNYKPGLQIDRIGNDKGYSPDNCRFVSVKENMQNKRPRTRCIRTNPTLCERDVREIRELLAGGVPQRAIGHRFRVTHGTIGAIKRGLTWSNIH